MKFPKLICILTQGGVLKFPMTEGVAVEFEKCLMAAMEKPDDSRWVGWEGSEIRFKIFRREVLGYWVVPNPDPKPDSSKKIIEILEKLTSEDGPEDWQKP